MVPNLGNVCLPAELLLPAATLWAPRRKFFVNNMAVDERDETILATWGTPPTSRAFCASISFSSRDSRLDETISRFPPARMSSTYNFPLHRARRRWKLVETSVNNARNEELPNVLDCSLVFAPRNCCGAAPGCLTATRQNLTILSVWMYSVAIGDVCTNLFFGTAVY